jgi:4'-phosphopantetheinyl transferase
VRLFFQAWTRKEAYVKARGLGLSLPLRAFEIDLDPARPAGLMKVENGVLEAAQWSLHDVELTAGYAAAVAVAAPEVRYSSWQVNRSPLSR